MNFSLQHLNTLKSLTACKIAKVSGFAVADLSKVPGGVSSTLKV